MYSQQQRRQYPAEFKRESVELLLRGSKPPGLVRQGVFKNYSGQLIESVRNFPESLSECHRIFHHIL